MSQQNQKNGKRGWRNFLLIVGILAAIVILILTPWDVYNLTSQPHPVQSYTEAVQRIESLRQQESAGMNPVCRLQFMSHGKKAGRAIILVHGYTNCPQQFEALGQQFYGLGYNVLIAALPHHGLADEMTDEHGQLKAEELAAYADETVDIAQGLGEKVIMLGISAGGVTTAWAAQTRSDIDLAVIISPAFGFKQIPTALTAAAMNVYLLLPDAFVWWDPVQKEKAPPVYRYPRYSRHALVQTLRLGFATRIEAQRKPPAAKEMLVVLNANDSSVNNDLTMDFVQTWQAEQARLNTYEFKAGLMLPHDIIDPNQPDQQVELVYPRLIELVDR